MFDFSSTASSVLSLAAIMVLWGAGWVSWHLLIDEDKPQGFSEGPERRFHPISTKGPNGWTFHAPMGYYEDTPGAAKDAAHPKPPRLGTTPGPGQKEIQ